MSLAPNLGCSRAGGGGELEVWLLPPLLPSVLDRSAAAQGEARDQYVPAAIHQPLSLRRQLLVPEKRIWMYAAEDFPRLQAYNAGDCVVGDVKVWPRSNGQRTVLCNFASQLQDSRNMRYHTDIVLSVGRIRHANKSASPILGSKVSASAVHWGAWVGCTMICASPL